jgi:HSP20 family molecular chaperone IbpA
VPPAELVEKNGTFEVKFAVAGVDPADVNLMVTRNQVALKSSYRHEHDVDSGRVHLCDFKSATVFRSLTLPEPIDVNTVKANFNHGILRLSAMKEGGASGASHSKRAATSDKKPTARKSRAKLS